ncbi:response regulator transcription factor [Paenibacillus yanchengensis]|uniref:Heme response regulator HssR n=1 Tax=Paenibacillus yanchengensis TaxID=2035833 RepID=A0ABW4YM59_9BACL
MITALVADDDQHIRELVCLFLQNEGYETLEAADGAEALQLYETHQIDIVVLDIMMPVIDGWALCKQLRKLNQHLPLLMLSARGETWEKVKGFELGTDDYMTKPFDPLELTVRVKSLLKRYRIDTTQTIILGNVTLNRQTYKVTVDNEAFSLPLKQFELLYKLASQPGQVFTRDQLIEQVWGFDFDGDERTIDVHIKRLRERFATTKTPISIHIETIRGLGYRLEVDQ